jgi:hypothetical protein
VLLGTAVAAVLLVSRLPEIVLREAFGLGVEWMPAAVVGTSAVLWFAAAVIPVLRPLGGFLGVMTGIAVLNAAVPILLASAAWQAIVPLTAGEVESIFAERILKTVLAVGFIGVVILAGTRSTDAYIRPGRSRPPPGSGCRGPAGRFDGPSLGPPGWSSSRP